MRLISTIGETVGLSNDAIRLIEQKLAKTIAWDCQRPREIIVTLESGVTFEHAKQALRDPNTQCVA